MKPQGFIKGGDKLLGVSAPIRCPIRSKRNRADLLGLSF